MADDSRSLIESTAALWLTRIIAPVVVIVSLGVGGYAFKGLFDMSAQHTVQLAKIHTMLSDGAKQRTEQMSDIHAVLKDHESRVRMLESRR